MAARSDLCEGGPYAPAPPLLNSPIDDGSGDPLLAELAMAVAADNARQQDLFNRQQSARSPSPAIVNGDFRYAASTSTPPFGWSQVGSPTGLTQTTTGNPGLGYSYVWSGANAGIGYTFNVKPCTWYTAVWHAWGAGKVVAGRDDGCGGVTEILAMLFSVGSKWTAFPNQASGTFTFQTNNSDTSLVLRLLATGAAQVGFAQVQIWEGASPRPFQDDSQGNRLAVSAADVLKGLRPKLNFVNSANVTWTVADDGTTDAVDATPDTIQGIATTSTPQFARLGLGAAAHASLILNILGAKQTTGIEGGAQVAITDTTAYNLSPMAGILFYAYKNTTPTAFPTGIIGGRKANAVLNDDDGQLFFGTNNDSDQVRIRMVLTEDGRLAVGGDFAPSATIEAFRSSGAQLVLSQQVGVQFATLTVDSSGNLTITPSGGVTTWGGTGIAYTAGWIIRPLSDADPAITWAKADGVTAVMALSTSTPGVAITGTLQCTRLGIGVAADATVPFYVLAATEQARLAFNAANYASLVISSAGEITIAPSAAGNVPAITLAGCVESHTPGSFTGVAWRSTCAAANAYRLELNAENLTGGVVSWAFRELNNNTLYDRMLVFDRGLIGIGTAAPGARLEVLALTEQIRASYSASVYASHTVASTGAYTIAPTGGTLNNIALLAAPASWQSMDRGLFIGNATTVPSAAPADGYFLYGTAGGQVVLWAGAACALNIRGATAAQLFLRDGNGLTGTDNYGIFEFASDHIRGWINYYTGGEGTLIQWLHVKGGVNDASLGVVGIRTDSPSNYADLTLGSNGCLCIKETTTPTADADYGKVYCKSDNKLYYQDGAGTEHEVALAT